MDKNDILEDLKIFSLEGEGIGGWITKNTNDEIFARLGCIKDKPISRSQLNQLLVLGHQAPVSDEFYQYYWSKCPEFHPYSVRMIPEFEKEWIGKKEIISLPHLKWGLYRIFVDGLLYFGNVRTAFRTLRTFNDQDLRKFFKERRINTENMERRGSSLDLQEIQADKRYLISEIACKSFGDGEKHRSEMYDALKISYCNHLNRGGGVITFRDLLSNNLPKEYSQKQESFEFSADDILGEEIQSKKELDAKFDKAYNIFRSCREAALINTKYYLSMAGDLDVYVATSMRTRENFRKMARFCEEIFSDEDQDLKRLNLRYFDPTLSAAENHEDKGLLECLMVKCSKILIYCADDRDSYGKDAEAAMALSLGKTVIFYCDDEKRVDLYKNIHPLSRLIDFKTGVAVGSMVANSPDQVKQLIKRFFRNQMKYTLEMTRPKYLHLKEDLTGSVVRLQTNDKMLTETFWNHYHNV